MARRHHLSKLRRLLSDLDEALALLQDNDPMTFAFVELQFEEIDCCMQDNETLLREHQLYELIAHAVATARQLSKERRGDEARAALLDTSKALILISKKNDMARAPSDLSQSSSRSH